MVFDIALAWRIANGENYGIWPGLWGRRLHRGHLTRALEGAYYAPPVFRKYLKNDGLQRCQIWGTCAPIKNTPCVQILTSQVKRSCHQVRSKSDMHSGTGPASNLKIVLWAQFQSEGFQNFRINIGAGTYRTYISDFLFILVTSGQVNFRPDPL